MFLTDLINECIRLPCSAFNAMNSKFIFKIFKDGYSDSEEIALLRRDGRSQLGQAAPKEKVWNNRARRMAISP